MKNLVIGLLLGSAVSCFAQAALTRHYAANTDVDIEKCFSEINDKSEASFKLTADGIDQSQATCWPDGIAISDK